MEILLEFLGNPWNCWVNKIRRIHLLAFIFIFNKSANCRFKNFYVDLNFAPILDVQYLKSIHPSLCTYKALKKYKMICLFREVPKTSLGGGCLFFKGGSDQSLLFQGGYRPNSAKIVGVLTKLRNAMRVDIYLKFQGGC